MRVGVEDTSAMGTSSPGPGAYFTGGNKQVEGGDTGKLGGGDDRKDSVWQAEFLS